MDMLPQLPGALYRLRSALPFKTTAQFAVPLRPAVAAQRWRTGCGRSVCHSPLWNREKLGNGGLGLDCESLSNRYFFSSNSGFRFYPGRRGSLYVGERCSRIPGHLRAQGLLVVAAARRVNTEAQDNSDAPSRFADSAVEGELDKAPHRYARVKKQTSSYSESSISPRSVHVESQTTVGNRSRNKPLKTQLGGLEKELGIETELVLRSNQLKTKSSWDKASNSRVSSRGRLEHSQSSSSRNSENRVRSFGSKADSSCANSSSQSRKSGAVRDSVGGTCSSFKNSVGRMSSLPKSEPNGRGEGKLKKGEKRAKEKHFPAEALLRRDLNMCSKDGDALRALEIYDRSVAEGVVKWNQYNFNILLYLCSSASLGTLTARKSGSDRAESERLRFSNTAEQIQNGTGLVESSSCAIEKQEPDGSGTSVKGSVADDVTTVLSQEVMELVQRRGFEIYEHMKRLKVPPNEATLTAVARLAVAKGDGDLAFQMVKEMAALNLAPKLRSYSPALFTYCKNKAAKEAFEVDAHMVSAGVEPEEPELAALLQLCVELGLGEEIYKLLHRLRVKVRALSPTTVAIIEQWFTGQAAASAGKENVKPDIASIRRAIVAGGGGWHGLGWLGEGEWKVEWATVDKEGFCGSSKEKLVTIDIDPQETENFALSLAELACSREAKPNEFKKFQEWLQQCGPFDAIVDGANIGLYNQNFAQGGFNFHQLNAVVTALQDQGLARRPPLIFLHHARTKFGAAITPQAQQLLQKWRSTNSLYTTPNGSNDDWYWLYAAVKNKCLLVTNDEMRDHLFQLLGTEFFPRWKERHQVRFTCTSKGPEFHLPPPYSIVIQESENGSWFIPKIGGDDIDTPCEWLYVTRTGRSSEPCSKDVISIENFVRQENFERSSAELLMKSKPREVNQAEMSSPTGLKSKLTESLVKPVVVASPSRKSTVLAPEMGKGSSSNPPSPQSGADEPSFQPKRARIHPPSTTYQKIKAADKKSESGPITFQI